MAAQKIGLLVFLQESVFSANYVKSGFFGLMYFPAVLVSLFFLAWPIKNPRLNLSLVFVGLAFLFLLFSAKNPLSFLLVLGFGAWLSFAMLSSMASGAEDVIRRVNSAVLATAILAEGAGTALITLNANPNRVASAVMVVCAVAIYFNAPSSGQTPGRSLSWAALDIRGIFRRSAPIMIMLLTAGAAEVIALKGVAALRMGAEAYGCMLVGHSFASIAGAFTNIRRENWWMAVASWVFGIVCLLFGGTWGLATGYALLGGTGTLVMKEFSVELVTASKENPSSMAANALFNSGCMALGSVVAVLITPAIR
jgi:hypothetical protein